MGQKLFVGFLTQSDGKKIIRWFFETGGMGQKLFGILNADMGQKNPILPVPSNT
jgi:hypothetical protein